MATFCERTAHSVNRMYYCLCLFVALIVSHICFDGRTLVLIASVPDHCLPFVVFVHTMPHTFCIIETSLYLNLHRIYYKKAQADTKL